MRRTTRTLRATLTTSVAVTAAVAGISACGASSGFGDSRILTTLSVSNTPHQQNGASAMLGNVHVAWDSATRVSTITFDVNITNTTQDTDSYTVFVGVEKSDDTTTGQDTMLATDDAHAGQTIVGHGTIQFIGPFPPNPKLEVTNIDSTNGSMMGQR